MKALIKIVLSKLWKDGKITTVVGVGLSGVVHNLFPNAGPEVLAIVDLIAGALIAGKDPKIGSHELPTN